MRAFAATAGMVLLAAIAAAEHAPAPDPLAESADPPALESTGPPETDDAQTPPPGEDAGEPPTFPEGFRFGPDPAHPAPSPGDEHPETDAAAPEPAPLPEPRAPLSDAAPFPCERLEYLWAGPYAGEPGAENDTDRPASSTEAAGVYAEYLRYLFLTSGNTTTCEVPHDPLITLANTCAGVARGRDSVGNLAGLIASDPAVVQAVWLMDAVVRFDRAHAAEWQAFFGPGPGIRIIGMLFDELPRGGAAVYEGLLRLTESTQGIYADYTARRFIDLFANRPQWVLLNAERLFPFGPALRGIFCAYLSVPEREALVLRYGEFPYSDAQAAVIELIACL